MSAGLFGPKIQPPAEGVPVLAPPSAGPSHLHLRLNTKNPTPFCSICGAEASPGQQMRYAGEQMIKAERAAELAEAIARQAE